MLLAERCVEILIHRANARKLNARGGAVWHGPDGFGLILLGQILLFTLLPIEVGTSSYAGIRPWTWWALLALALAQGLRYWCIVTLGDRWSVRVVTVPGVARELGGPYRWMRHPNYLVVMAEVVLLPLAFGAWITLAVLAPLKAIALMRRIRIEERALTGSAHPNG